jgi:hypothetical protein
MMGRRVVIGFRDGTSVGFDWDEGWTSEDEELARIFNAAYPRETIGEGSPDEPDPLLGWAMPIAKHWKGKVIWISEEFEGEAEGDREVVY